MAAKIRVLSDETINKIAAGEVIENPASVVKELVDNSIDSGATEISIEIREGGRQLIRVTDNGSGMGSDDAILCLERHATSKIRSVEEIFSTDTMGFRGEAIPSIASISKFTLITRLQGSKETEGTVVIVEGGQLLNTAPVACAAGTTIEVKSLFYNVPVRRKFQKSPSYDTQEIIKLITWLAFAYPHIHFKLSESAKTLLSTPLDSAVANLQEQLSERIKMLLGTGYHEAVTPIEAHSGLFQLNGFIGLPSHHRPNRTGQFLCINKRPVFFSPLVGNAVKEGFGTMLPAQRYPVYVLHLSLPGELVDANVHPQKREVRLRQEQALKEFLRASVLKALQGSQSDEYEEKLTLKAPVSSFDFSLPLPRVEDLSDTPAVPYVPSPAPLFLRPAAPKSYAQMPLVKSEEKSDFRALPEVVAALPGYFLVEGFSCVEFLQLQAPFVMVDQAAVRARLIFDQLIAKAGRVVSQGLLIPHSFSLTPVDSALLQSHLEALEKSGFSIHASGPQSFLLEALPQVLSTVSLNDLMADIVAGIAEKSASETVQERVGKRLSYLAARNASGKMRLSLDECRLLLKQLFAHQISYYCPKGKPIFAPLRVEDLERLFQSLSS